MRKQKIFVVGMIALMAFTGCGDKLKNATVSTIYVDKNSQVSSISMEVFDESYYDQEELEQFIQKEVNNYNGGADEKSAPVVVEKLEVKDQRANLRMKFQTLEDYNAFNGASLVVSDVNSLEAGTKVVDAKSGEEVEAASLANPDQLKVLTVEEPSIEDAIQVIVDGKIAAYTKGCESVDPDTVKVPKEQISYILYR